MSEYILAFETTTTVGSVAILGGGGVLRQIELEEGYRHGTDLMPAAVECMAAAGVTPAELAAVAVGSGPGSYTGTRIGVMAAKALAWGAGVKLIGVSSLEAVAWGARELGGTVVVLMNARRDEVYAGAYRFGGGGLEIVQPDIACEPEQALALVSADCAVVGSAVAAEFDFYREKLPDAKISTDFSAPKACAIGQLAAQKLAEGKTSDPLTFQPIYLRKEDGAPFA